MSSNGKTDLTYLSPDGWFSLAYPSTWEFDNEENCTSFFKQYEGVGALQISAYQADTDQHAYDILTEYLRDNGIGAGTTLEHSNERQEAAAAEFENATSFTRIWIITRGFYLVFVTYVCEPSSREVEISEVREIVRSKQVAV